MSNYELYHYGVKGMKWGVRKKYYGLSKRQAKKAIKNARKTAREESDNTNTNYKRYNSSSTGKAYDKVAKKYNEELLSKTAETRAKMNKLNSRNMSNDAYEKEWKTLGKQLTKERKEVAKKYVDKYNEARLEDMKYDNIKLGKQMLKDYGLSFTVNEYGIVEKRGRIVNVQ